MLGEKKKKKKDKRDIRFANIVWRNNLDSLIASRVSVSIYLSVLHNFSGVSFSVLYVNERAQSPGLFPLTIRERNVSRFKSNKVIGYLICWSFLKIVSCPGKFVASPGAKQFLRLFFFFLKLGYKIFLNRDVKFFLCLNTILYYKNVIGCCCRKTTRKNRSFLILNFQ